MKLFDRNELTIRNNIVQSSCTKYGSGQVGFTVGVKLGMAGRLSRTTVFNFDVRDPKDLGKKLAAYVTEVLDLAAALKEVRDWMEANKDLAVVKQDTVTFTKVTEQEWPTLFYAVNGFGSMELHIYGRNLNSANIGFRKGSDELFQNWVAEIDQIIANFYTHLEEIEKLTMQDFMSAPKEPVEVPVFETEEA